MSISPSSPCPSSQCSSSSAQADLDTARTILSQTNHAMGDYLQSLTLPDAERQQAADQFHAQLPQIIARMRQFLESKYQPLHLCGCMGPVGTDPHCPCKMHSLGLVPTNPWTPEKQAELDAALAPLET